MKRAAIRLFASGLLAIAIHSPIQAGEPVQTPTMARVGLGTSWGPGDLLLLMSSWGDEFTLPSRPSLVPVSLPIYRGDLRLEPALGMIRASYPRGDGGQRAQATFLDFSLSIARAFRPAPDVVMYAGARAQVQSDPSYDGTSAIAGAVSLMVGCEYFWIPRVSVGIEEWLSASSALPLESERITGFSTRAFLRVYFHQAELAEEKKAAP